MHLVWTSTEGSNILMAIRNIGSIEKMVSDIERIKRSKERLGKKIDVNLTRELSATIVGHRLKTVACSV